MLRTGEEPIRPFDGLFYGCQLGALCWGRPAGGWQAKVGQRWRRRRRRRRIGCLAHTGRRAGDAVITKRGGPVTPHWGCVRCRGLPATAAGQNNAAQFPAATAESPRRANSIGRHVTGSVGDPGYMSRKIRKFKTDKFDTRNKRKF